MTIAAWYARLRERDGSGEGEMLCQTLVSTKTKEREDELRDVREREQRDRRRLTEIQQLHRIERLLTVPSSKDDQLPIDDVSTVISSSIWNRTSPRGDVSSSSVAVLVLRWRRDDLPPRESGRIEDPGVVESGVTVSSSEDDEGRGSEEGS